MTPCQETCGRVNSGCKFNVVPFFKPSSSLFDPTIASLCKDDRFPTLGYDKSKIAKEGDRICFGIKEGNPNDSGSAYDITTDPEDPVWYSTCYVKQASPTIQFKGNTCGKACELDASIVPCRA